LASFSELKRTHNCGELSLADIGQEVRLNGWVNANRNLGGVLFVDLRDRYGITQIVLHPEKLDQKMMADADRSRSEFVVAAVGTVVERPQGTKNDKIATGEIEIEVKEFHILSESKTPPFEITDDCKANEMLRLEFRYLDLRRGPLQKSIYLRHKTALATRQYLDKQGFYEIETPLLLRSTPEGARDYVVPSRVYKGKFFALPQSPQLLKQILMVSGFDKYFQIARCLRDEDLRADRQPEHTQIDIEMSFVTPDDVFAVVEGLMSAVFEAILGVSIKTPFPRHTYNECMHRWGIDKPDLRFGMEIIDLTNVVKDCGFEVFTKNIKQGGVVKGIVLNGGAEYSRKQIDDLTEKAKEFGAKGLAYILRTGTEDKSPITKFIGESVKEALCQTANLGKGDALFMVSDRKGVTEQILGQLRLNLGRQHKLMDKSGWEFLWVTEFPLFHYDETNKRFDAMHNIVSHPHYDDLQLIEQGFQDANFDNFEHPWKKARAMQYDLVINGWEIASGGQRINKRDLQQKILNILGINNERAEKMFGFLLRAFEYGAPPHAGIAAGLDRLVALMIGAESIRDVIAFPKTANAISPMDGSPTEIDQDQLDELGLIIKNSGKN